MQKYLFPASIILLFAYRFLHFGNIIDDPHAWRQYDTLVYILDYYKNSINMLRPSVCWMGSYKTLLLEFPLYEAIVAILYRVFGESLVWARLVSLAFFAGACFYFYKITKKLFNKSIAEYSTILFTAMPLSLYYSRAIQIDFMVLFFSLAMLWYILMGYINFNLRYYLLGITFASLAFVCKAPIAFCLLFPILAYILSNNKINIAFKWSLYWLIPLFLTIYWISYSKSINEQAPDWNKIIPGFHNFTKMNHWYYGTMAQRLDWKNWDTIINRIYHEILGGKFGTFLLFIGIFTVKSFNNRWFLWIWILGTIIYLNIFFNLNLHHNYYQISFLAPSALSLGISIHFIQTLLEKKINKFNVAFYIPYIVLIILVSSYIKIAEKDYYKEDKISNEIAFRISQNTPEDAIIINSFDWQDKFCPLILAPARRYGWSVPHFLLNSNVVHSLKKEGASFLALTIKKENLPDSALIKKEYILVKKEEFEGWNFYLYKI